MRFSPYFSDINFQAKKKIEYNDATTVSMAKMLGKKQLGVREYRDFGSDSLEVLNFINRGLVAAKNASRNNIRLFGYVDLRDIPTLQMSTKYMGGILTVNQNIYDEKRIGDEITRISKEMIKDKVIVKDDGKYLINPLISSPQAADFMQGIERNFSRNLSQLSYDEKIDLYHSLRVFYEQTSQLNRFPKDLIIKMFEAGCWGEFDKSVNELFSEELKAVSNDDNFKILFNYLKEFGNAKFNFDFDILKHKTIFHEVGHLQDCELFFEPNVSEFSSWDNYPKKLKEWLNDKASLKAAFEVSPYACYGKDEFFAECYSWLLSGKQLPQAAQELYKKIKAPKVVLR